MKNSNRRRSHGHHGSKRRELAQHAHSHGPHAFTHTLYVNTVQPRGAKRQLSYFIILNLGCFFPSCILLDCGSQIRGAVGRLQSGSCLVGLRVGRGLLAAPHRKSAASARKEVHFPRLSSFPIRSS